MKLERKLLYTEKKMLSEFLDKNPFNQALYIFIHNVPNLQDEKVAIEVYNEIYFQCTRLWNNYYTSPELFEKYMSELRRNKSEQYCEAIMFGVYAILYSKKEQRYPILLLLDYMKQQYDACNFIQSSVQVIIKKIGISGGNTDMDLTPCPVSPNEIIAKYDGPRKSRDFYLDNKYSVQWKEITRGFNELMIRTIVQRFKTKEDKIAIINEICIQMNQYFDTDVFMFEQKPGVVSFDFFAEYKKEVEEGIDNQFPHYRDQSLVGLNLELAWQRLDNIGDLLEDVSKKNRNQDEQIEEQNKEIEELRERIKVLETFSLDKIVEYASSKHCDKETARNISLMLNHLSAKGPIGTDIIAMVNKINEAHIDEPDSPKQTVNMNNITNIISNSHQSASPANAIIDDKDKRTGGNENHNASPDVEKCRQDIRMYVDRVRNFVNDQEAWPQIWNDIILDDRLSDVILAVGKQKETTFNRSLVANIIHLLGVEQKMMKFYNASELAKKLESSVNHSVRASLGLNPSDKEIVEVVNEIFSRVCARN